MSARTQRTFWTIAPYVAWMALMMLLPTSAAAYAGRAAVAAVLLAAWGAYEARARKREREAARPESRLLHSDDAAGHGIGSVLLWGVVTGVVVCVLWIYPERFAWYRTLFVLGADVPAAEPSPYDPAVCGWALTMARLIGSAFVIAPAEELFFRSYLYRRLQSRDWSAVPLAAFDVSAFLWMVALFALEHSRWLAGAMAGACYGFVAMRRGIGSAIVAHVVTNLLLALYVIHRGAWNFW